jgi:hypothetical protein
MFFVPFKFKHLRLGVNPTIMSNSASATSSLVRFANKNLFHLTLRIALVYYNSGVVAVNARPNPTVASYNANLAPNGENAINQSVDYGRMSCVSELGKL